MIFFDNNNNQMLKYKSDPHYKYEFANALVSLKSLMTKDSLK